MEGLVLGCRIIKYMKLMRGVRVGDRFGSD